MTTNKGLKMMPPSGQRNTALHTVFALIGMILYLAVALPALAATFSYDDLGRLLRADYGNGVTYQYTYDAAGNIITLVAMTDHDNDGFADSIDIFPDDAGEWSDFDGDGIGDNADLDDDNDGVPDLNDAFPNNATENHDADDDGVGDNSDPDDDNDGIADAEDLDDDNDGMPDSWESAYGLDPLHPDGGEDLDGDGVTNFDEYLAGTSPTENNPIISGRVTNGAGLPVSNILVEAWDGFKSSVAITRADGFYSLSVIPSAAYRVMVNGANQYVSAIYDNVFLWDDATLVDVSAGSRSGIDFSIAEGLTITGTVNGLAVDESAEIYAWSDSSQSWAYTVLNGSGSGSEAFVLGGLLNAPDYDIYVQPANHAGGYLLPDSHLGSWEQAATISATTAGLTVVLDTGRSISGTLYGLTAGETIWVTACGEDSRLFNSVEVTATSSDTSFIIGNLPPLDDYFVSFSSDRYLGGFYGGIQDGNATSPTSWQAATAINTTVADQDNVNVIFNDGVTISGCLTGLASGDRAELSAWSESTDGWARVLITGTGEEVNYELSGLAPNSDYRVSINASGYVAGFYSPTGITALMGAATTIDASTSATGIDFILDAGQSISGLVSSLDLGEKAWIEALSNSTGSWRTTSVVGSTSAVTYSITGLPLAYDYQVTVLPENHASRTVTNVDNSFNPTNINFIVGPGYSITGLISGATAYEKITVYADNLTSGNRESTTVWANASGEATYEIKGLGAAADYKVRVETSTKVVFFGDVSNATDATMINLTDGNSTGRDFHLNLIATATISGTVAGVTENSMIWIDAWDVSNGNWNGSQRRGNGDFSISLPADSTYKLALYAEGFVDAFYVGVNGNDPTEGDLSPAVADAISIDLNGGDVSIATLTMTSGYTYSGKVYFDLNGNGVADSDEMVDGAMVEVSDGSLLRNNSTDTSGTFQINGMPAGNYTVTVRCLRGSHSTSLTGFSADISDAEIVIDNTANTIQGTVTASDSPVINAVIRIFAEDPAGSFINAVITDNNGQYQYTGLDAGTYTVQVDRYGDGSIISTAVVEMSSESSVTNDVLW